MFDTSGDGEISQDEFRRALDKMGRKLTEDQLDDLIRQIDSDHSGTISIKEFLTAVKVRLIWKWFPFIYLFCGQSLNAFVLQKFCY